MTLPALVNISLPVGNIAYRSAGEGLPLFLMHGLAGNSRSWVHQFEYFSARHQVIAWDAPGYGGSDDLRPDVDLFTDALNQLTDHLQLDKFVLLGHSMGGVLAGRYATRFADQLHGLVLSCTQTGAGHARGLPLPESYRNRVRDLNSMSSKDYGRARAKAMLAPDTAADIFDMAADISAETRPSGLEKAARVIVETDNSEGLKALVLPTLVIAGEVDPVMSRERTDRLAQLVSGSRSVVIEGAGHAPYLEKPESYNSALQTFIDSC